MKFITTWDPFYAGLVDKCIQDVYINDIVTTSIQFYEWKQKEREANVFTTIISLNFNNLATTVIYFYLWTFVNVNNMK